MTEDKRRREEFVRNLVLIRDYLQKRLHLFLDQNQMDKARVIAGEISQLNYEIDKAEA